MKFYTVEQATEYISKHFYISNKMVRYWSNPKRKILKGEWTGKIWIYEKEELDRFIRNFKKTK